MATPRGPIGKYPPGTALLAAPLYTVIRDREPATLAYYQWNEAGEQLIIETELPKLWPAGLVAALTTAGAMAALAAPVRSFLGGRWAWIGAIVLGLGTSLWSVLPMPCGNTDPPHLASPWPSRDVTGLIPDGKFSALPSPSWCVRKRP